MCKYCENECTWAFLHGLMGRLHDGSYISKFISLPMTQERTARGPGPRFQGATIEARKALGSTYNTRGLKLREGFFHFDCVRKPMARIQKSSSHAHSISRGDVRSLAVEVQQTTRLWDEGREASISKVRCRYSRRQNETHRRQHAPPGIS